MPDSSSPENRRFGERYLACFPASVTPSDMKQRLSIIRELSESGALLLVATTKIVPGERVAERLVSRLRMRYGYRMRLSLGLSVFGACAVTVLVAACGGSTASSPAMGDGDASSVDAGGTVDSGGMVDTGGAIGDAAEEDAASACGSVSNAAPMVELTKQASDPPTLSGGTITPGTYFVSAHTSFTGVGGDSGPTGVFESDTLALTSTNYAEAFAIDEPDAAAPTRIDLGGTYSVIGAMLSFDEQCPEAGVQMVPYSALGKTLTVLSRGTTATDMYVYSGQF